MGDVADIIGGGTPKTGRAEYWEGGTIPWITPADLSGYREKFISGGARNITAKGLEASAARLMPEGTVLFSSRAPIGYVAIAANAVATNQGFKSFVPGPDVIPEYLYYYLQRAKPLAERLSSGTTFREVSAKRAARIPVPVPPTDQQSRIVTRLDEVFSNLDAGVAALQRARANVARYRAAVLKAAVEGRLTEQWRRENPDVEAASELLRRMLDERKKSSEHEGLPESEAKGRERPKRWKDASHEALHASKEGPALPDNWCWASVGLIADDIAYGYTASAIEQERGPRFLRITDIQNGRVEWAKVPSCSIEDSEIDKYRLARGDILFARTGATVGKTFLVQKCPEAIFASFLVRVRVNPFVVPEYVFAYFQTTDYWRQILKQRRGVGQPGVNATALRELVLPLPPHEEQREIARWVGAEAARIETAIRSLEAQQRRSANLRRGILAKAFSGQL